MIQNSIYRLSDDVFCSKKMDSVRIIKLVGEDVIYEATLVAGEIVQKINGKQNVDELIKAVAAQYDQKYEIEIREKGMELFKKLEELQIIVAV